MIEIVILTCLVAVVIGVLRLYRDLQANIVKAKQTDLPYIVGPFIPFGYLNLFTAEAFGPILRLIPIINRWGWLDIANRQISYAAPRVAENRYGDTFLVVTPGPFYLKTSSAELISQITTRKTDFLKPVDHYQIVDLFGRSILTQEGQEWKRHRKIVGPSFSEKSNRMVFEESLRQTEGMLGLWSSQQHDSKDELRIGHTDEDAATLSLHIICAAGFGVPQLWPHQGEDQLVGNGVPGFSEHGLTKDHTMSFKKGLTQLMDSLMWYVVLSKKALSISPLKVHQRAHCAFDEVMTYFHELLDIKTKQMRLGETTKGTMDLLGPMIKANEESISTSISGEKGQTARLTTSEILGNCFIFLFAGHETTANNIHFSILELAMNIDIQKHSQEDIDAIIGPHKPTSEWSYTEDMPRLYNSMVGATMSESLRLIPAILNIPKVTKTPQPINLHSRTMTIPANTFIHLNVVGTHLNPAYWGADASTYRPERWLPTTDTNHDGNTNKVLGSDTEIDGLETASFEKTTSTSLLIPPKGSYIPFSDGQRACPGRRFAQVEATAVLAAIFQKWSVELDVSEFASGKNVDNMTKDERRDLYGKAVASAREKIRRCEQTVTLKMRKGDKVPVVFRRRGKENFWDL